MCSAAAVYALQVRDPRANYLQTLSVLRAAKECGVYTKSSIMLGLGETGELGDAFLGTGLTEAPGLQGYEATGRWEAANYSVAATRSQAHNVAEDDLF